jgi:hypothetical protein
VAISPLENNIWYWVLNSESPHDVDKASNTCHVWDERNYTILVGLLLEPHDVIVLVLSHTEPHRPETVYDWRESKKKKLSFPWKDPIQQRDGHDELHVDSCEELVEQHP